MALPVLRAGPRESKLAASLEQAGLVAAPEEGSAVADWASLHGDLAQRSPDAVAVGAPVEWRVYDQTHVEFAIDYAIGDRAHEHVWEAYFFIPESFRLSPDTYDKPAVYDDLWSYVRYAVPAISLAGLASLEEAAPLALVRGARCAALGQPASSREAARATRELRFFACLLRGAGVSAMRVAERSLVRDPNVAEAFVEASRAVVDGFRRVLEDALFHGGLAPEVEAAAQWTDEDISLLIETLCASLRVAPALQVMPPAPRSALATTLTASATHEAEYRRARGYDASVSPVATKRARDPSACSGIKRRFARGPWRTRATRRTRPTSRP